MSSDAEPQLASGAEAPLAPRDTLGHAFVAARAGKRRDGAATILNAFYVDDRVRRMFVQLAFQFRQVDYADEARQRVALLFFDTYVPQILTNGTPPQGVYSLVYALAMTYFAPYARKTALTNIVMKATIRPKMVRRMMLDRLTWRLLSPKTFYPPYTAGSIWNEHKLKLRVGCS